MQLHTSRRSVLIGAAAAAAAAVLPAPSAYAAAGEAKPVTTRQRRPGTAGPSIEIDPTFSYYQGRSPASIADELAVNGYRIAHYFVVNERQVDGALVDALHRRGIAVWALVVGNGSYATDGWPSGWQNWQMQLLKPIDLGGFHYFSPFSDAYVAWKKKLAATLVSTYPFDGFEIAEPYFPEWNGIESGDYGDVGPLAQAAFQREYGLAIPDFADPSSPTYYKTDTSRYRKWIQFRVDAVNRYVNEIINGPGGVRRARPDILVATWSLGINAGPASVALEREYEGLDAGAMVAAVRPDLHILQTNWPDWTQPDLPPDYVTTYQPFVDQIRAYSREVPIGVQADIGSQLAMARDDAWIHKFAVTGSQMGLSTWTAYEYHIGGYMYTDPPVPKVAGMPTRDSVELSFSKRIDPASAAQPRSFQLITPRSSMFIAPDGVTVDGNRVTLQTGQLPPGPLRIAVRNVADTPSYWLYNTDGPANVVPAGTVISVSPAGDARRPG